MPLRRAQARSHGTMPLGIGKFQLLDLLRVESDGDAVAERVGQRQAVLRKDSDLVAAEHLRGKAGEGLVLDLQRRRNVLTLRQLEDRSP